MPGPGSNVADLIMQLMMRGKSGGLPMQASPELVQYLAHAQGGTAPPQQRMMPSADVLNGPGGSQAEIRQPFDFEQQPSPMSMVDDRLSFQTTLPTGTYDQIKRQVAQMSMEELEPLLDRYGLRFDPKFPPQSSVIDDLARQIADEQLLPSQTFRQESYGEFADVPIWIWYTHPKTGKRIKLDGPFTDDLSARRAFNELRESGLTDPLEISPY